jgi:hypothetical protein
MLRSAFLIIAAANLIALFPQAAGAQAILVPREAVWKYDDTGTDLGTEWRDSSYVDGSWASGPAILGYGEPYIDTTISYGPDSNDKYPTAYFRIAFNLLDDPADVEDLFLEANYDDGFVAYINGVEVTRQKMPEGDITYGTYASEGHEGGEYERIDISSSVGLLAPGRNTLAVEVHQATPSSSDLVMDMQLSYGGLPALLTRGPYLQLGTPTSIIVRWRTDLPTDSRVRYGFDPQELFFAVDDTTQTTEHEVRIEDLSPYTLYYYSIGSTESQLAGGDFDHRFRTHPSEGEQAIRVWVIGDSGTGNYNAVKVRDAYLSYEGSDSTDVWLMLGDNAYGHGTDEEYQDAVFDMYPMLLRNTILWPSRGNHDDLHPGPNNDYYEFFTLPTEGEAGGVPSGSEAYYSYEFANAHFICLDSEGSDREPEGPMLTWLAEDLAETSRDWIIAYWHHPPYTKGSHDSDDTLDSDGRMFDMRENALPILEAGGADLILCGHSHSYERSFLLDGHYGLSTTLEDSMIIDGGDGSLDGDGAYEKPSAGPAPHEGCVYAVAGSSGKTTPGEFGHPVMVTSLEILGSVVLDIEGQQLDAVFLDDQGEILDDFTIIKGSGTSSIGNVAASSKATLRVGPNPLFGSAQIRYATKTVGAVRLSIYDTRGRKVRDLVRETAPPGRHTALWDGRDDGGRPVAAGTYFSVLVAGDEVSSKKMIVVK